MKVEWRVTKYRNGGSGSIDTYKLEAVGFGSQEDCEMMKKFYLDGADKECESRNGKLLPSR